MSQHLFIGGPADGQFIEVPVVELHVPYYVVAPVTYDFESTLYPEMFGTKTVEYWACRIWEGERQETVYTLDRNANAITVIQALLAGYRKGEDYPDDAIELGRTFERQFFMEWCHENLGHLPIGLHRYLRASLERAKAALSKKKS